MIAPNRLRDVREARGMLQEDLESASGVTQGTISRVENGSRPSLAVAIRLARALGTTVEELFGGPIDVEPPVDAPEAP